MPTRQCNEVSHGTQTCQPRHISTIILIDLRGCWREGTSSPAHWYGSIPRTSRHLKLSSSTRLKMEPPEGELGTSEASGDDTAQILPPLHWNEVQE